MSSLDSRVDEFVRAPVAAAVFVLAAGHGLGPARLAEPATVSALAALAMRRLGPWTGAAAAERAGVLDAVRPARDLVAAVLSDPRNAWWSAPLAPADQLLLTGRDEPRPDPMRLVPPTGPIGTWETYAQKPLRGVATSTALPVPAGEPIRSGAHAALACWAGDWVPAYPVRQLRLDVSATARVYEVDSAADWHRLALRYGDPATHPGSDPNLREIAGLDNGLAPTWSAVAADYDGVHLTFAGLLTSLFVPVHSGPAHGGVGTTLWAWEWERTHWLRSAFTAVEHLPDLPGPPDDPGFHAG